MRGPRGYHSYRGDRGSGWKVLAAVGLALVTLAALGVVYVQTHYIVYDENGQPHVELPWSRPDPAEEQENEIPPDVDVTIQEPEGPPPLRAVTTAETPLTQAGLETALAAAQAAGADGLMVTVKDDEGIYFPAANASAVKVAEDTAPALAAAGGSDTRLIARMSCFLDSRAARADLEGMGLKNTGGYVFYDGNNRNWLDPVKPAARDYLMAMARQLAELGADELVLTHVSYPTVGKLDKVAYGETDSARNLEAFLRELREALEPYGTVLTLELSIQALTAGGDALGRLDLAGAGPLVDRICAPAATAEEAESLAALVAAASPDTAFVPIFPALPAGWTGDFLLSAT